MADDLQHAQEAVGETFDTGMFLETRRRTWAAIADIAAAMKPGMTEEAGVETALAILKDQGLLRGWHGVNVRFGPNTTKLFHDASIPGTVLRENDIFFVDIGPVWDKWEGDGGDTFVVGEDPLMHKAKRDVRAVFDATQAAWRADGLTGEALYEVAVAEAQARGWDLLREMTGHRLSDFPHSAIHKGGLAKTPYRPSSGLWVLEIQIRHPTEPIGAFYEDLMFDVDPPA